MTRDRNVEKPPPPGCPTCGKRTANECSHLDCGNRKRVTAQPLEQLEPIDPGSGTYRVPPRRSNY